MSRGVPTPDCEPSGPISSLLPGQIINTMFRSPSAEVKDFEPRASYTLSGIVLNHNHHTYKSLRLPQIRVGTVSQPTEIADGRHFVRFIKTVHRYALKMPYIRSLFPGGLRVERRKVEFVTTGGGVAVIETGVLEPADRNGALGGHQVRQSVVYHPPDPG